MKRPFPASSPEGGPIGRILEIKGDTFTVVGVVAKMETFTPKIESIQDYNLYADTSAGSIYLPDSAWPIVYQFDEPQSVAVQATSTDAMTRAGKNVADALTASQISATGSASQGGEMAAADNVSAEVETEGGAEWQRHVFCLPESGPAAAGPAASGNE